MTLDELRALPVAVNLETAGRAFGLGRATCYDLASRGEFPVPVMKVGGQWRVKRSDLLRSLDAATDGAA